MRSVWRAGSWAAGGVTRRGGEDNSRRRSVSGGGPCPSLARGPTCRLTDKCNCGNQWLAGRTGHGTEAAVEGQKHREVIPRISGSRGARIKG